MLVVFAFSTVAFAENAERNRRYRFRTEALSSLVLLPGYFYLGLTIHEGSHAVAAMAHGIGVYAFKPYPHTIVDEDGGRNSVLGATYIQWPEENPPSRSVIVSTFLAPYIADMLFFTASDLLLTFLPNFRNSFFGSVLFIAGMVCPLIDFAYNLYNPSSLNDFAVAAEYSRERRALFYSVGTIIVATALWRTVQTGFRVFVEGAPEPRVIRRREARRNQRVSNIQVSPTFGEINGLAVSMSM